jgi:hypothetical protein
MRHDATRDSELYCGLMAIVPSTYKARLIGGPADGAGVLFFANPPTIFTCDPSTRPVAKDKVEICLPGEARYRRACTLESGEVIYEYLEPTQQAELAYVLEVPGDITAAEKGRIATAVEKYLRQGDIVKSAHLHYTGPIR